MKRRLSTSRIYNSGTGTEHSRTTQPYELLGILREVESMFEGLRRLQAKLRRAEESDWESGIEARVDLGESRRQTCHRLQLMIDQLRPLLIEQDFWCPGRGLLRSLDDGVWPYLPQSFDGLETLFRYLIRLRRLLLKAVEASPETVNAGVTQNPSSGHHPGADHGPADSRRADPIVRTVQPPLMTVREFARHTGQSEKAVYHQISDGKLPVVREGRKPYINTRALDRWIDSNTEWAGKGQGLTSSTRAL